MTPPTDPAAALEALHQSEQRLLRTVDSLTADQYTEPSVLPDWTRAHVVAHLALNAEGLAGALDGLVHGRDVPVYESAERRDTDIGELAAADPAEIRDRFFAAGQRFRDALGRLGPAEWEGSISRAPDGPQWPVVTVPATRRREVEVHHADLGAGYGPADWPEDFTVGLLDLVVADHTASPDTPAFTVHPTDVVRTWSLGADHPVVEGTAGDLAWWLLGRGTGEGLSCETGALPRLGPWRRTQAPTRAP
jgi:maleylpyruvate isomerase